MEGKPMFSCFFAHPFRLSDISFLHILYILEHVSLLIVLNLIRNIYFGGKIYISENSEYSNVFAAEAEMSSLLVANMDQGSRNLRVICFTFQSCPRTTEILYNSITGQ